MNKKILFVDDDLSVLEGYRRALHGDYEPDIAIGGPEALKAVANSGPYAVVLSDMRMPSMNGVQLLSHVGEISPDTIRVILTGYADLASALAAVNEGHIFRFLTKPCPAEVLKKTVGACLEQHRLVTAEKELIEQTLTGSIKVLTDVLILANPYAFRRAARIRRYVRHVVAQMGLEGAWQCEMAAMLSQLGCIALPPEIIEAAYRGEPLCREEQTVFDMHPSVARKLISHIPRLETVAWMVGQQRFGAAIPNVRVSPAMRIGAEVLRLAIAMDDLKIQGQSDDEAVARLGHDPQFDPSIVAVLESIPRESPPELRSVDIPELCDGMVVQEEIRTQAGELLAERGQEITYSLLVRLNNLHHLHDVPGKILVSDAIGGAGPLKQRRCAADGQ